ncbi:uncharacterized protein C1orf50 homolog [Trichogramma pretiosum]|uniref:uncharacterized protein C1orf50 homolog n=1 Tax=Trichogramma pretiosum TaxID=7493 RepID=UPI0006C9752C|nr:uncharacterized protein C1orf50 homolog [Trichogramma pretiosum]
MVFNYLKRKNTDLYTMDCTPNKVALVERNMAPLNVQLVDAKAIAKKAPNDLVELAMEIQKADNSVKVSACSKLQVIAEQMRFLQQQAHRILLEAKENSSRHHAACNFVKHPGNIYHLYEKESGQSYFSMLSPQEWGESGPKQTYKGSFRLEHDYSWTPVSEVETKDKELALINRLYENNELSSNVSLTEYMSISDS